MRRFLLAFVGLYGTVAGLIAMLAVLLHLRTAPGLSQLRLGIEGTILLGVACLVVSLPCLTLFLRRPDR